MKALYFRQFGDADVLEYGKVDDPEPQRGRAIVELEAIGLNFADIYRRRGHYHLAGKPPYIAGYEGAGKIVQLDDPFGTSGLKVGQRVGFADSPFANAELASVELDRLIPLPDGITCEIAAAVLLQGLTAHYLVRDSHLIKEGELAVVHAAAGGVGLLLLQMIRHLGGKAMAIVSTEVKARAASDAGAYEVVGSGADWVEVAKRLTDGRGADVVYDSIGSTLLQSLEATRVGGDVVFFGMAGGDPPYINPRILMDGSKRLAGGDLWNVLTSRDERRRRAAELFDWINEGKIEWRIARRFSLRKGADAHRFLESREAIGKVLLIP